MQSNEFCECKLNFARCAMVWLGRSEEEEGGLVVVESAHRSLYLLLYFFCVGFRRFSPVFANISLFYTSVAPLCVHPSTHTGGVPVSHSQTDTTSMMASSIGLSAQVLYLYLAPYQFGTAAPSKRVHISCGWQAKGDGVQSVKRPESIRRESRHPCAWRARQYNVIDAAMFLWVVFIFSRSSGWYSCALRATVAMQVLRRCVRETGTIDHFYIIYSYLRTCTNTHTANGSEHLTAVRLDFKAAASDSLERHFERLWLFIWI